MKPTTINERRTPQHELPDAEILSTIVGRLNNTPQFGSFNHRAGDQGLQLKNVSFGDILSRLCDAGLLSPVSGEFPGYEKRYDGSINLERLLGVITNNAKPKALSDGSTAQTLPYKSFAGVPSADISVRHGRGPLTRSEVKFLILVSRGLSTAKAIETIEREIVGKRTGDFHLFNLSKKIKDSIEQDTGIRPRRLSRTRSVIHAIRKGWLDPQEIVDPEFPQQPKIKMTPMEVAVAQRLIMGFSSKEIAIDLAMSDPSGKYSKRTVDFHINDLFDKLSVGGVVINNRLLLLQALIHQYNSYGLADQPDPHRPIYGRLPEIGPSRGTELALPFTAS